ncbi:MAG: hypothetical protein L0Y37_00025 [Bacteroidales bacterium]|nr:hypothetical protein [Bacteroidales bacterium]
MKKRDLIFIAGFAAVFVPFFVSDKLFDFFLWFSREWAFTASFIKFAILATMGEMLGSRIRTGIYLPEGFALLYRAVVWGFLGMTVKAAFMIFGGGTPLIMVHLGMEDPAAVMAGPVTGARVLLALAISTFLNIFYAPVLMVTHRVSDLHIAAAAGDRRKLFKVPDVTGLLASIDWNSMWGIVLKKSILLFWIPAQTVNFLLPEEFRILVAALYSTLLGVILALAAGQVKTEDGRRKTEDRRLLTNMTNSRKSCLIKFLSWCHR